MAQTAVLIATLFNIAGGFVLPDREYSTPSSTLAHDAIYLSRKDALGSSNGPVQQEIDFTTRLPNRQILIEEQSGFTITCIDCSIEGRFLLGANFDIDQAVVSELSVLATSVAVVASTVASEVTSIASTVASGATSVVTQAAGAVTSIGSQAAAGATSVEIQASSILNSIVASAAPVVQSAASDVGSFFTSLFPRGPEREPLSRRQQPQLSSPIKNPIMSLIQTAPIKASFKLEFVTKNASVKLAFSAPAPFPGILPVGPPTIPIGPVQFGLAIQPLGLAFSAVLQPNMNVTLPFGADITFGEPLLVTETGIQDANPTVTIHSSPPILNQFDPSLCLSATIGPFFKLVFELPDIDMKIHLNTQLDLPKVSLCLNELSNVNEKCQPTGSIEEALNINANISLGVSSDFSFELPQELAKVLPSPPQIPGLTKEFNILNECIDRNRKDAVPMNESFTIDGVNSRITTDVISDTTDVAQMTSTVTASISPGEISSQESGSQTITGMQPSTSIIEPPVIESVYFTVTTSPDAPSQLNTEKGSPLSFTVADFDEPFGMVFLLPTHLAMVGKQF